MKPGFLKKYELADRIIYRIEKLSKPEIREDKLIERSIHIFNEILKEIKDIFKERERLSFEQYAGALNDSISLLERLTNLFGKVDKEKVSEKNLNEADRLIKEYYLLHLKINEEISEHTHMKEVFLIRHGRTKENERGIIQGQKPGHLSLEGKEQARKVGGMLGNLHFDVIYSSDLKRAKQTARIIRNSVKNRPKILYLKRLRERSFGQFDGKPATALGYSAEEIKKYADFFEQKFVSMNNIGVLKTAESLNAVRSRLVSFWVQYILRSKYSRFLIVAHADLNSYLQNILRNERTKFHSQDNDQVVYIKLENNKVVDIIENYTQFAKNR